MYKSQFRKMDPYGLWFRVTFMSYLSKHYFCICNCRLNAFMSVCNTSMPLQMKLLHFLCIAKINFVDTDLISLVTA